MKRFIKFTAILAVISIVFAVTASAATLKPTNFFVNDYASVISEDDETTIFQKGENLYHACKAQVAVVTIDTLDGVPIEEYAYNLATEWGLGDEVEDNGVLILLAAKDREVRIEVGSGLEGALPDSKTGRILDKYGMDYFAEDNFSAGLASVQNSVVNEIYIEYGLDPDEDYEPVDDDSFSVAEIIIIVLVIILFIISRFGRRGRGGFFFFPPFMGGGGHYGGGSGGYSGGGGFSGGGGGFSGGGSSRNF